METVYNTQGLLNLCTGLVPFQRSFLDDIYEAEQQGAYKEEHLYKANFAEGIEVDRPWVHKDDFHVKHDEKDSGEEVFDRKGNAGITYALDTAFEVHQFVACQPSGARKADCH